MHYKTKEAAVKKYSHHESLVVLIQTIKAENVDLTEEEVFEIVEAIIASRQVPKPLQIQQEAPKTPVIHMEKYDMWRGELVMMKDRKIPGTGQREIIQMRFQLIESKPKRSGIPMPPEKAEFWNITHFTARKQTTDMLFPAGQKLDMVFTFNDDTERFEITTRELETA